MGNQIVFDTTKDIAHAARNSVRNKLVVWNAASNSQMLNDIEALGGVDKVKADKQKAKEIQDELL